MAFPEWSWLILSLVGALTFSSLCFYRVMALTPLPPYDRDHRQPPLEMGDFETEA